MVLLSGKSQLGSIAEVLALLIVFLLILAAAYYVTKYFGKTMTGYKMGGNIRLIETVRIAPEKYLQIVEVAERYFLLAVSKGNISLISELNKQDMKIEIGGEKNSESPFKEVFQKMIKK